MNDYLDELKEILLNFIRHEHAIYTREHHLQALTTPRGLFALYFFFHVLPRVERLLQTSMYLRLESATVRTELDNLLHRYLSTQQDPGGPKTDLTRQQSLLDLPDLISSVLTALDTPEEWDLASLMMLAQYFQTMLEQGRQTIESHAVTEVENRIELVPSPALYDAELAGVFLESHLYGLSNTIATFHSNSSTTYINFMLRLERFNRLVGFPELDPVLAAFLSELNYRWNVTDGDENNHEVFIQNLFQGVDQDDVEAYQTYLETTTSLEDMTERWDLHALYRPHYLSRFLAAFATKLPLPYQAVLKALLEESFLEQRYEDGGVISPRFLLTPAALRLQLEMDHGHVNHARPLLHPASQTDA